MKIIVCVIFAVVSMAAAAGVADVLNNVPLVGDALGGAANALPGVGGDGDGGIVPDLPGGNGGIVPGLPNLPLPGGLGGLQGLLRSVLQLAQRLLVEVLALLRNLLNGGGLSNPGGPNLPIPNLPVPDLPLPVDA